MYTVTLRKLLENEQAKREIDKALSTYPLYQQMEEGKVQGLIPTREELNNKLLNHFKYREIGFETVGRFIDELEIAMCEIMPYYNQMLRTVDIMNAIEDPFGNVDIVETINEKRSSNSSNEASTTSTGSSTSNGSSENSASGTEKNTVSGSVDNVKKESDTPQSNISDIDEYLSQASVENTDSESTSNSQTSSSGNVSTNESSQTSGSTQSSDSGQSSSTFEHTATKKGNQGVNTYAHDIAELRTTILNIEQMIIQDQRIQELFLLIF